MPDYEARWYVVHTYSGYENKVAGDLIRNMVSTHAKSTLGQFVLRGSIYFYESICS